MNTQENESAQLYDARLEKLIELALVDGVLTEKKKQILMKKAVEFGIDPDEFEMVLDAKLYSKQQEATPKPNASLKIRINNEEDDEYDDEDEYDEEENNDFANNEDDSDGDLVFTASRLSKDNKLFPPSIVFDEAGIRVKLPSLFKKNESFIPYSAISEVSIETPLIGFSTIEFVGLDMRYRLSGFMKDEVLQMQRILKNGGL